MDSLRSTFAGLTLCVAVAACDGGSGGGGSIPSPRPSTTSDPANTRATGTLVDDPSGTPLAGVAVRLDPWHWGNGPIAGSAPDYTPPPNIVPGPSPTPILTTTTDAHGHFTIIAPNGTYLLVIGSDDNTDTTRPTIHDKALLYGQSVLAAPSMPPIPGITPAPVETSGDYRLVTIDRVHELPCINDYDQQRTQRGLPKPVIDEWLTENVRGWVQQSTTPYVGKTDPKNPFGFLTIGSAEVNGGTSCSSMFPFSFTGRNQWAISPGALWFAGSYLPYQSGSIHSAYGASLFPVDPRLFIDPVIPNWL